MYQTCLHCQRSLSANEAIEHLPIGRRIAFDGHRGRLWVVCGRCGRWNLVPFESRWEALEECEKAFRTATRRAATEQIALARLSEGLDLIRIGEPLRSEFSAWRYGESIRRRIRQQRLRVAGLTAVAVPIVGLSVANSLGLVGAGLGSAVPFVFHLYTSVHHWLVPVLTLRDPQRGPIRLTQHRLLKVGFRRRDDGEFAVRLGGGWHDGRVIEGPPARFALAAVLARQNLDATRQALDGAERELLQAGGPERFLADADRLIRVKPSGSMRRLAGGEDGSILIRPHRRLALEMALHEESERRALEGELHLLLEAWREAEELAAIADRLALPIDVEEKLEAMKGERSRKQ